MPFYNRCAELWETYFRKFDRKSFAFCAAVISLLYLIIITFPGHYHAINPTLLDESWVYTLNNLCKSNYLFGKDIVFTYGPLTYLMIPRHIGSNIEQSLVFMLSMHALLAVILFFYLRDTRHKTQFSLFVLCYSLTYALTLTDNFLNLWYEYYLLVVFLLLCYLPSKLNKPPIFPGLIIGILAPLFTMIKFSLGCSCFMTIILATIAWKLEFAERANRLIITTYISLIISLTAFSVVYLKSINSFCAWLYGSWEIAKGYGDSMSMPIDTGVMNRAIFLLGITLIGTLILVWKKTQIGYLYLISLAVLFISFRHSVIRHQTPFFLLYLAVISMTALACRQQKMAHKCFWWFAIVCMLSLLPVSNFGVPLSNVTSILDTTRGQQNIRKLFKINATIKKLDIETKKKL